ncbi:MAG: hypothetical protein IJ812_05465 [Schwartzia sp.]|nr:hypothetical protein [Schwartzia sp. (in: firmicutes)]
MGIESMDALAALRALAAKSGTASKANTTMKAAEQENSFSEVFAKMEEEQKKWDALMDQVDIAQYKLALSDCFWSDQADPKKHISNYLERHQGKQGTEALDALAQNVSMLNHLNRLGVLKGAVSDAELTTLNRKISAAYASMMAARSVGSYF